ncbi:MAG: amino acid adenylation domain-containing protein [Nitrospirales bacterium]|nr:amino acid adenylation domain-containing protein [Nitrospirales bacterium]
MRDKSNIESMYYLSPLQQGLLFHRIADAGEDPYFYQYVYLLKGALQPDAFERAWQEVVKRHSIFRTAFVWEGVDKPVQVVRREASLSIQRLDWREIPEVEHDRMLQSLLDLDRSVGWDFLLPPLMRLHLVRTTAKQWLLINSHHHILLDGWSMALVLKDVLAAYEAVVEKRTLASTAPRPYRDYISWLNRQDMEKAESYWREALKGFSAPTPLSIEPPQDLVEENSFPFAEQSLRISSIRTATLQSFSRQLRITLNTMIQGAWALLLHRYSGESDVLFGATVSGRPAELSGVADMVGLFINTVPIRVAIHSDMALSAWLRGVQEQNSLLRQYEWTPLASIQRWSEIAGGRALFDSLVVFESYPEMDAGDLPQALTVEPGFVHKSGPYTLTTGRNNYPLSLMVEPGREITLIVSYAYRRFAHPAVSRLLRHLDTLLDNMMIAPERPLRELSFLPDEERRQLTAWNRVASSSPASDVCVHALIEAKVQERPDALAVETEFDRLSYRELDRRANRLAHYLQEHGVGPETRVAICLERSLDLVIALLGVLKAGGAYVPLDPGFPEERLVQMVTESGAVIVLSNSSQAKRLSGFKDTLVLLDQLVRDIAQRDDHPPSTGVTPENLAYVIYTSGSTGRPKGVAVEHRQIVQYVRTVMERLALPLEAGMAAVSTVAADLGNTALFGALCSGRALHLLSADHGFDPNAMADYMHDHAVDVLKVVPSHLKGLLSAEHPERVLPRHCLILGGEAVRPDLIERVKTLVPACAIVNHYGPTETTVGVLTHLAEGVSPGETGVPIGRPLSSTQVYVLDPDGQQVPIGMAGELYIGGGQVARGYLGRPEITAERFLPDAFGGEAGTRLYRTGDRVRVRTDGAIEFLGRVDNQVKVRGFRIELGEIDAHLRLEPSIAEAVTVVREGPDGAQQLVTYLVGNSTIDTSAIRSRLALRLPDYMVPQMVVVLDAIPLTANGKVDRTALQDLHQHLSIDDAAYVAPRNPIEEILAAVWTDVLRVERVGVHDNFFGLGGDSIRTLQVIARANQLGVKLTPKQLFEHQTVATAAAVARWKDMERSHAHSEPEPSSLDGPSTHTQTANESLQPIPTHTTTESLRPVFPMTEVEPDRLLELRDDWEDIEDCYPLAPMQEGMLFHTLMNPGSGMYLMQQHYVWEGQMNRDAFGRAWQRVIDRHPILRTSFMWKDLNRPLQLVHRRVNAGEVIEDVDLSHLSEEQQRLQVTRSLEQELTMGLEFTRAPLMRIRLIRQSADRWTIVRSFHHILTDDWCFSLLMMDFMAHYEAFVEGRDLILPSSPPYREYIAWLQRQDLKAARQFWESELAGFTSPTPLGIECVEPNIPVTDSSVGDVYMELSPEVSRRLQELAQQYQLTPNTFVQGAWTILLARYSGEEDVLFGVTVAGRPTDLPGVEGIMGLFINTLPLRVTVLPQLALMPWLKDLLAANYRIRQYEYAPLVEIQQWSEVPPGQALFQSLLVFENAPKDSRLGENRHDRVISYEHDRVHTNYPITVVGYPGETMGVRLSYDRRILEHDAVERMLGHLKILLEAMAVSPDAKIHELPMIGNGERHRILMDWNDTDRVEKIDESFPLLFEAQVLRTPEAIAVQSGTHRLSYKDLNRAGNRVAHALRALGTEPDTLVAVLDERGMAFMSMIVGILKAGGAYVPLDLHHPVERLAHVFAASRVGVVVSREEHAGLLDQVFGILPEERKPKVLFVERMAMENWPDENPRPIDARSHLAYVIYTSGSTGFPKGAMVDCQGMVNHLTSKIPTLRLGPADIVAQTASQCFDISVWQFLSPILCGACVHIIADDVVRDPQRLLQEVADRKVTVLEVVPSLLSSMLECPHLALRNLRWLLPTGEALSPDLCRRWLSRYPHVPLVNAYGPAECSDDVAVARIEHLPSEQMTRMPIGKPIDRVRLYIVDRHLEPVPAGVVGELCVGGAAVGRGYVHDPARTAEVFLPDPFGPESGGRLYRTGDLARHRLDGMIEFMGRRDYQVKIRGFRIELGEIEARLSQHPDVARSVVVVRDDHPGRKQLVAYVVTTRPVTGEAIRMFVRQALPDYMVPVAVVFLASLPLTPNGKINRKALPAPESERSQDPWEAPTTPTQDLIAGIWSEVLGTDRVGRHDNFFDLGGHSLLATQVMSRVREAFQLELPLRSLFDFPTVEEFAAAIDRAVAQDTGGLAPPIVPVVGGGRLPLSFAQQRLWFLAQMNPESGAYNLPFALRLEGSLNRAALEESFVELVRRHETLRTTFPSIDGEARQVIVPSERFALEIEDLTGCSEEERTATIMRRVEGEAQRPFALECDLPIRARLLQVKPDEHILLVTVHHIAADAWSLSLVTHEVATVYTARVDALVPPSEVSVVSLKERLPDLPIQYSDFSSWQREWLQGARLEKEVGYWKKRLGSNPPQLALKTDYPRPEHQTFRGGRVTFLIPKEIAESLKALSRRQGATVFMTLLAAFKVLLARSTGQTDILVGTDVANRNRHETEHLIGFFVNLLPLRTDVSGNPSFIDLLGRVREVALGAYAHQDVPFEKIVEALKLSRDLSRNPLVQVLFVLQNVPPPSLQLPDLSVEALEWEHDVSRFDLGLFMEETDEGLAGLWKFSRDLFEPDTIVALADCFVTLLRQIVMSPDCGIDRLDILSAEDKEARTMEAKQREEGKLQRFKSIKPKAVALSKRTLVESRPLLPDHSLPLLFSPAVEDIDLVGWAQSNQTMLQRELLNHGALIFRGFSTRTVADFESVAQAVCPELFGEYGDLPREKSGRHVYGSTPYPPDKAILFHNESSHMHRWPQKQFFFCLQAAPEGGETPIVDGRIIYQGLRPELRERLQSKQLMYVRNFTPGVDVSWQDFFRTPDRSVVEEMCAHNGMECLWMESDSLRTRQVCPAVVQHPKTGEWVFFNQIQLHHVSCLEPAVRESLLSMLGMESIPRNVYYGDGAPIDDATVSEIGELYERTAVRFRWQEGDLLMLDNMLVAHARDPFTGPRKIVVAMGDMISQAAFQSVTV